MTFRTKSITLALGLALSSAAANAGYLSIEDTSHGQGTFNLDSSVNDYVADGSIADPVVTDGQEVYTGRQVAASQDGPFLLTFDYLYKEASDTNSFTFNGENLFTTSGTNGEKNQTVSRVFYGNDGDLLDFAFSVGGTTVNNWDNDSGQEANFFVDRLDDDFSTLVLGWDDGGGVGGDDDNHDDMILKVTASKVPEPGTLALLGLGLAGLGMSYRRRS